MQMCNDDCIEVRHVLPREGVKYRLVRPSIDEDRMCAILHEDRVALSHVEHANARRCKETPSREEAGDGERHDAYAQTQPSRREFRPPNEYGHEQHPDDPSQTATRLKANDGNGKRI